MFVKDPSNLISHYRIACSRIAILGLVLAVLGSGFNLLGLVLRFGVWVLRFWDRGSRFPHWDLGVLQDTTLIRSASLTGCEII